MGSAIARHMTRAGHEVSIANSRGPDTHGEVAAETGATPATIADALRSADVVFLAIPYPAVDETSALGEWEGKIVVDLTNNYSEPPPPGGEATSVAVGSKLPGARVVKAFNTIWFRRLNDEPGLAIFYATDDDEAGDTVAELIREAGFAPVKSGGLQDGGKRQEPGSDIYNVPMTEDEARAILRP